MGLKKKFVSIVGVALMTFSMGTAAFAQEGDSPSQVPVDVIVGAPEDAAISWSIVRTAPFTSVPASFDEDESVTGQMSVTVSDNRYTQRGWALSVSGSDFVGLETPTEGFNVGQLSFDASAVTVLNGQDEPVPVAESFTMTEAPQPLFHTPRGSGSGRYSTILTGTVVVPANTLADTYRSIITVTLNQAP